MLYVFAKFILLLLISTVLGLFLGFINFFVLGYLSMEWGIPLDLVIYEHLGIILAFYVVVVSVLSVKWRKALYLYAVLPVFI